MSEADLLQLAVAIKAIANVIGGDVAHTAHEIMGALVDNDLLSYPEAKLVEKLLPLA